MKYPKYQYRSETSMSYYEFISEGPKGLIKKIVEFTETGTENVYNLGFADYDEKTKKYTLYNYNKRIVGPINDNIQSIDKVNILVKIC